MRLEARQARLKAEKKSKKVKQEVDGAEPTAAEENGASSSGLLKSTQDKVKVKTEKGLEKSKYT